MRSVTLFLAFLLFTSCKRGNESVLKDEVVKDKDGSIALLYSPKIDKETICLSSCTENPVDAIRNLRFDICGMNGKALSLSKAFNIVKASVTASDGTAKDAETILKNIQNAPQATGDDSTEVRPQGFVTAIRSLANFMKDEGAQDPRCNAEQHLKEYPIASLINKSTAIVSSAPAPAKLNESKPKQNEHFAVCKWIYSGWFNTYRGIVQGNDSISAQNNAQQECANSVGEKYKQGCKVYGCDEISVATEQGPFWSDHYNTHQIGRRRKSDGYLCDQWGNELYVQRPEKPRAPCFTAGTMISTPAGQVAIESLNVGDQVFSFDFQTRRQKIGVIRSTSEKPSEQTILFTLDNGTTIEATPDHPFFDASNQIWVRASEIENGTLLQQVADEGDAQSSNVKVLNRQFTQKKQTVYNLEVDGHHNYFANGILVHNY